MADAFGLALFTIFGTAKALVYGAGNTNAILLGVITGVAGGIMRDVLVGEFRWPFGLACICMPPRPQLR